MNGASIATIGLVLLGASWSADASAATITVTSNGAALSNDGTCTLPEAVKAVNLRQRSGAASGECVAGDGANDSIQLMPTTQTYNLSGSLVINRSVRINGSGRTLSIVRSTATRIFDIQPLSGVAGPVVTLSALAIENGRSDNNAVYGVYFNGSVESPRLDLTDVVVRNCTNGVRAIGLGQTDNQVTGWKLAIESSKAEGFYCAGCAADLEQTKITGSQGSGVRTRSLESDGWPTSLVVLTDSVVDNNGSTSTLGGGIRIDGGGGGVVNLVTSTVSNNRGSNGGGVYTQGGLLAVYTSTISSNTATRGGGIYIDSEPSGGPTPGENNLYNTTIANNTASTRGGGLFVAGRQALLSATILGDNTDNGSGTKSPDCYGNVSMWTESGNMIENSTGCNAGSSPGWLYQGDLGLGPLIDVGTGTGIKAHFPLKASPLINSFWFDGLPAKDQRLMSRPEPHFWPDGSLFFGFMWEPGAIEYNTTWHPQHLNVAGSSGDSHTPVDSDGYFRFAPNAVGDYVAFAIPVSEAGVYDVVAHVGKMRDGGNYQLEVSNSLAGPFVPILTQDFYTAASVPSKTAMTTGSVTIPAAGTFTPGLRYFRFRVLGKASTSIGYRLRLAYFDVAKR